jgi:hypothetical protein
METLTGSSETIRQIPEMNRELAILLGLLYTDGCVCKKDNSWRIYFATKSDRLPAILGECIMHLFALEQSRVRFGRTSDGLVRVVVNSKEIGNYLVGRFGTFRTLRFEDGTLPPAKLPVELLMSSQHTSDFLRAAFSCDGGIGFYPAYRSGSRGGTRWLIRTIFLACAHPQLRTDFNTLLQSLGIRAREVVGDRKLKIENEKDIRLFEERVGFLPGVSITDHSKFWRDLHKDEVLKLMIASYSNPSETLKLSRFNKVMI